MSFDSSLPRPYSEAWREAYRHDEDDTPRLSAYQAPGGSPVPFVLDNIRLTGGQSVDTAEYPFDGKWSNTSINEKPHMITVSGFIRGETYIKNRNAMVEALLVTTDDINAGFIDLPLWGRFPVVVVNYDVEEKAKENGQCAVSFTFCRAGVTVEERWAFNDNGFDTFGKAAEAAQSLEDAAIENFEKTLEGNTDTNSLVQGFSQVKNSLVNTIGRVQGEISNLNRMTNAATNITNLIAQGVRSPRELASALFGAAASIVTGIMEIRNSFDDNISFLSGKNNNDKNALMQFFSAGTYKIPMEVATAKQSITKDSTENLFRTVALSSAAQILVQTEKTGMTYQTAANYWALYEKLEASVDQGNPEIYRAIRSLCLAVSMVLSARELDAELVRTIPLPVPLLYLSQVLGCDEGKLRQLNTISDSFAIQGDVIYA